MTPVYVEDAAVVEARRRARHAASAARFRPSLAAEDYWRRVIICLVLTYLGLVGAGIVVSLLARSGG